MAFDNFNGDSDVSSPGTKHVAVTPTDELSALPFVPKALWIGTAGNLTCAVIDEPTKFVTYKNLKNGDIFPMRVVFILATGTTCADIVAIG